MKLLLIPSVTLAQSLGYNPGYVGILLVAFSGGRRVFLNAPPA
jgi:hypothetical protein